MRLIERMRYDNLFSFIYSARPHTSAIRHEEKWGLVPYPLAVQRLERLQARQRELTLERNRALVGQAVEVLVEGPSRTDPNRVMGRTRHNQVVHFDGRAPKGAFATVVIERATVASLAGVEQAFTPPPVPVETPVRTKLPVVTGPIA